MEGAAMAVKAQIREPAAAADVAITEDELYSSRQKVEEEWKEQPCGGRPHHVVMLPAPFPSHIKVMMQLARAMVSSRAACEVTFVNTKANHERFIRSNGERVVGRDGTPPSSQPTILATAAGCRIRLVAIPDGLSKDENPAEEKRIEAYETNLVEPFEQLLASLCPPPTCIIADLFMAWALPLAKGRSIPGIALWVEAASTLAACAQISALAEQGYIPIVAADHALSMTDDLRPPLHRIVSLPGLKPGVFRTRDLPSYFLVPGVPLADNYIVQLTIRQMKLVALYATCVLTNSIPELEREAEQALPQLFRHLSVGPLFAAMAPSPSVRATVAVASNVSPPSELDRTVATPCTTSQPSELEGSVGNLWTEDARALRWLDTKAPDSIVYVSFGSVSKLSLAEAREIAMGLHESSQPFLWSLRLELLEHGGSDDLHDHEEAAPSATRFDIQEGEVFDGQGLVLPWVDQLKVLAHRAVGAFLTHCGWNSVMESLWHAKPMLCYPRFADQRINCRLAEEAWGVGREVGPASDQDALVRREQVEATVRAVMEVGSEERARIKGRCEEVKRLVQGRALSTSTSNLHSVLDKIFA